MLSDFTGADKVFIACGYTDLAQHLVFGTYNTVEIFIVNIFI